jgi:hypothetical protein
MFCDKFLANIHMSTCIRLVLIILPFMVMASAEDAADRCFSPFVKGRYWLYDGTVAYIKKDEVKEQHMTRWKSEVIDTFEGKDFKAALLKGSPFELAWYQEDKRRQDVIVWLNNDGKFGIIINDKDLAGRFALIKATSVLPVDLTDAAELTINTVLGVEDLKDEGLASRYEWIVGDISKAPLAPAVKGLAAAAEYKIIDLSYRGAPEHAYLKFVVGVGISAYTYVHHGTRGDCEVKLVETGITQLPKPMPLAH